MALFDPARLFTQLQNTGLQNKDTPLFQLINQMIGAMVAINKQQNAEAAAGSAASAAEACQRTFGSAGGSTDSCMECTGEWYDSGRQRTAIGA